MFPTANAISSFTTDIKVRCLVSLPLILSSLFSFTEQVPRGSNQTMTHNFLSEWMCAFTTGGISTHIFNIVLMTHF